MEAVVVLARQTAWLLLCSLYSIIPHCFITTSMLCKIVFLFLFLPLPHDSAVMNLILYYIPPPFFFLFFFLKKKETFATLTTYVYTCTRLQRIQLGLPGV
jgi:hypothetical protein